MKKFFKILLFSLITLLIYCGVLYSIQEELIFYPNKHYVSPQKKSLDMFEEKPFISHDGTKIMAWYYKGDIDKPAILFFHGNAGQIATFAPELRLLTENNYTVFAVEIRGFAGIKGKLTQENLFKDAAVAFDWLKKEGYKTIVVYGYSFGTSIASGLTSLRDVDGLILTSPFSSLESLVSEMPIPLAPYLLKYKLPSIKYISQYKKPLLLIHSKKDKLIPYHHSQWLYDACPSDHKVIHLLEKENHNTFFRNQPYILDFLKKFE
ncbi:MAG: alpha/beta hydrolase [Alphaproteobacteria bacterium]|nr:alpha/beta hydrolase [Alphaproteobacteria bacterium]